MGRVMRWAVLACVCLTTACRSRGHREAWAEPPGSRDPLEFADSPLTFETRLPVVQARVEPFALPLGDDVDDARLSPRGWVGTSSSIKGDVLTGHALVERPGTDKPAVAASVEEAWLYLRPAPKDVYVHFYVHRENYDKDGDAWMTRIDGSRAVRVPGAPDAEWFADTPAGLRAGRHDIINREYRWQLYAVGKKEFRPLGEEHRDEMMFGLVAPPGELLVAAGKADMSSHAPMDAQVRAVMDLVGKGDGRAAARLGGRPRGYLLHMTTDGELVSEEPFPEQRPEGIALTDDGWIVVLGGGTLARALKDCMVVTRKATEARKDPGPWRVLAQDLVTPSHLIQRGGWVCFDENTDHDSAVHCLNPGRRLHVVSPRVNAATLYDIDLRGQPRAIFRQGLDLRGSPDKPRAMAMPLP